MATKATTQTTPESAPAGAADDYVNAVLEEGAHVTPTPFFTIPGRDPFDEIEWETRHAHIPGKDRPAFDQKDVEFPKFWSQTATNIVLRNISGAGCPPRARALREADDRPRRRHDRRWGRDGGYFATEEDAQTFEDELKAILVNQMAAFNSPVWFNVGFEETPQCSACFILSIEDSMDSILDWIRREGVIFRGGSGSGVNLSKLRSSKEQLSKGGYASGPVSFMRRADASAGTIKSGGKTRRAAKMVVLDVDHPDIEEFVWCKAREGEKARVLEAAGYDMSLDSPDGARSSTRTRTTPCVVRRVHDRGREQRDWNLTRPHRRLGGRAPESAQAPARHRGGRVALRRPGRPVRTTINSWHTLPKSSRINAFEPVLPRRRAGAHLARPDDVQSALRPCAGRRGVPGLHA